MSEYTEYKVVYTASKETRKVVTHCINADYEITKPIYEQLIEGSNYEWLIHVLRKDSGYNDISDIRVRKVVTDIQDTPLSVSDEDNSN